MSAGDLEPRPALDGHVVDGDQLGDDEAGELAAAGKLLAVTAYAGADHGRRLIDGSTALSKLHSPRDPEHDFRCKTCRTSSGKPAPWPCETLVIVLEAMGMPVAIDVEAMRDWGRVRNGGTPRTAAGRAMLATLAEGELRSEAPPEPDLLGGWGLTCPVVRQPARRVPTSGALMCSSTTPVRGPVGLFNRTKRGGVMQWQERRTGPPVGRHPLVEGGCADADRVPAVVDWSAARPQPWRPPLTLERHPTRPPLIIIDDPVWRPSSVLEAIRWQAEGDELAHERARAAGYPMPRPPLFPLGREPRGWSGEVWPRQYGRAAVVAAATWPHIGPHLRRTPATTLGGCHG